MDIRPAAPTPSLPVESLLRLSLTPPLPSTAIESDVAVLLTAVADPQIAALLNTIENARLTVAPENFNPLLRTAVIAAQSHRPAEALAAVSALIERNPEHAARLLNDEPAVAPLHADIQTLFQRLAISARSTAEHTLSAATLVAQNAERSPVFNPQAALMLAQQFLETGQHINFIRATELGRIVLERYARLPEPSAASHVPNTARSVRVLATLWKRAPLLVLLLGWLIAGLLIGVLNPAFFRIWGLGFLTLVVLQFIASIRNYRS